MRKEGRHLGSLPDMAFAWSSANAWGPVVRSWNFLLSGNDE